MANTVDNVAVGKPAITGGLWVAPAGTTLPTDATTTLGAAFTCLGYVSEDGMANSMEADTVEIKAWGGDTVYSGTNGKTVTWAGTLIEILNTDVLKTVFGSANVTGTLSTGITLTVNNTDPEENVVVVETILRGALRRVVLPKAKVTAVGTITYADSDVVGYETTFTCMPDSYGNMQYEYTEEIPDES